jgi:hypothetical protein
MPRIRPLAAAVFAAIALVSAIAPSLASTFFGWQVSDVSSDDVLMVRAYPSSQSQILVGYPSGVALSMTGRCTGGLDMNDIAGLPRWQQRQLVQGAWCEVWIDPYATGDFRNGWVYGAYISPM